MASLRSSPHDSPPRSQQLSESSHHKQPSRDMSAVATLHMQDLDVADADNRTSHLMKPFVPRQPGWTRSPRPNQSTPVPQNHESQPRPRQRHGINPGISSEESTGRPGQTQTAQEHCEDETNAKYCYRHRPDLKSIRRADDFSLEQVQKRSRKELGVMSHIEQQSIQNVWSLFSGASGKQRELMLRGMLAQCCFPQLSFVSVCVRELLKIDFLTALPPELGLRILSFLDARSLCEAAQVSRTWKNLADDDVVWHRMCEQHTSRKCNICGWGLPYTDRLRSRHSSSTQNPQHPHNLQQLPLPSTHTRSQISHDEIHQYPDSASDDGEPTSPSQHKSTGSRKRTAAAILPAHLTTYKKSCTPEHNYEGAETYFQPPPQGAARPWKEVYRDRFIIGTNWKYGRCTERVLKGHANEVTCLQFDDEIIATGSYDTTIKIWNLSTGEELRTLRGHTMGVKCLQFDKSKLVSGSLDGTLKMWDLRNGKVIRTFPGHSGAVVSVHFDGSILASGSQDRTIRVRDFASCSRVSLRGHTDYVNAVRVDAGSQTLFSASDDSTVRIWDLKGKRCLRILRGHSLQVTQVLPLPCGFEIPSLSSEGGVPAEETAPSTSTGTADASVPAPSTTNARSTSSDNTNSDATISIPLGQTPPPPPTHPGTHCPPKYILSTSMDCTIRLWSVSSGHCLRTFFGHMEGIWAIAADSLRMVTGSNDGVVKVWDPRTGRHERSFRGHRGPVTAVGLSERGMVTASEDREVRVYDFAAPR